MQLSTLSRASIVLSVAAAGVLLSVMLLIGSNRAPQSDRAARSAPQSERTLRDRGSASCAMGLENPITVEATGHKFFWRFRFPGPDAQFNTGDDVRVENELHLPLGHDIVLRITSDDFVYTMAIPELDLRQIAIPDLIYTLNFHTTTTGCFDVIADSMCSVRFFHDESMGRVVIQSESAFDSWYKQLQ